MDLRLVSECWFVTCGEPAAVEALGTYGDDARPGETVPLVLCARHAILLRDEVVLFAP
jgi:hypothetical protein